MNLIIDVGNSLMKLAVFNDGKLQTKVTSEKKNFLSALKGIINDFSGLKHCIVSSVGSFSEEELHVLKQCLSVIVLSHELKLLFINEYATPTTLGVDRIALVCAAAYQYPNKNVLVIDVGSCITYDFLTSENKYLGGAIAPGLEMRYKALHHFTANLPLLTAKVPENLVGNSTNNSMHIGVFQGVISEIEGFVNRYIENFSHLTVILTGGDAHFLRDSIKNDIFANSNFLLEGLNYILEINKD
ncbi:MAG: type III pantothenate kinase [Flavobacteriaceae bacterium]|nr:type III pantothenate kinase [Flavobacteriaceae bacterium]